MVVGACRIALAFPGNRSLKGKRSVVRKVQNQFRRCANVAVAEVGLLDVHQTIVLGLSVVSNDRRHARQIIDRAVAALEDASGLRSHSVEIEVNSLGTFVQSDVDGSLGEDRGDAAVMEEAAGAVGDAGVFGDAQVFGGAVVPGNATVPGNKGSRGS